MTRRAALLITFLLGAALLSGARGRAEEALDAPNLEAYRPDDRKMAEEVLAGATFEVDRRMSVHADPAVLRFLIDHPDFAAAVSRGLGLDQFRVWREGARYQVTRGFARGTFWVAEERAAAVAYLATGTYEHPLLRAAGIRLRARSFVTETFDSDPGQAPTNEVRLRIRGSLQVENSVLGPVLRSFGPLVRGAFESNLTAAYRIAPGLSEAALLDRESLLEKVRQIGDLDQSLLSQFEELVRAQPRSAAASSGRPASVAGADPRD